MVRAKRTVGLVDPIPAPVAEEKTEPKPKKSKKSK